ncbi:MAG: hypothetical protein AB2404_01730, partial [Planifilum fimeticola]
LIIRGYIDFRDRRYRNSVTRFVKDALDIFFVIAHFSFQICRESDPSATAEVPERSMPPCFVEVVTASLVQLLLLAPVSTNSELKSTYPWKNGETT